MSRLWFVEDVMQTSYLRLRRYRSAMVEKRSGRDGPGEKFALSSRPNKPENAFPARPASNLPTLTSFQVDKFPSGLRRAAPNHPQVL